VPLIRPTDEQFADVAFAQRYACDHVEVPLDGLDGLDRLEGVGRMAVVDESSAGDERGTFLLLHGEPSWSALYEHWIPDLTAAGFRCVAPDLIGFGRSDKVTDDDWYTYERHVGAIAHVMRELDLRHVHLVVQDWAGPIGLRQLVDDPDRFDRAFVFNTWLHHDAHEYSEGVRFWRSLAVDPERLGGDMPTGRIVAGTMRRPDHDREALTLVYDAPFTTFESKAGARAFPTMLPWVEPERGGALAQERCYRSLTTEPPCPVHVVFGDADPVFPYEQGVQLAASIPGATIDRIPNAGHFVQADAPADCLEVIRRRLG
jgi:haloalkane dehalogenase